MRYLKTGVANVVDIGPAVIGTTGGTLVSPVTGLTNAGVDEVGVYKNGATALTSTTASAITHRAGGIYTLSLSTAHVDTVGRLTFYLRDDSACLPIRHEFEVLPANVYDSLVAGSDTLKTDIDAINGSSVAALVVQLLNSAAHYGKAAAGAAGTITLSTAAVRTANYYRGSAAYIYSGPGSGQSPRYITAGTTALVQSVSPNWTTTPTTASYVLVLPAPPSITASSAFPKVDVGALGASTQSMADLKDFADAGYDPATNKVQGLVLADNVTTLTGHTAQTGDSFARLGANGAGLSAVPWNAAWDAEVESEVTDALVAANLDHVALTGTTTAPGAGTYLGRVMHASTAGTYDRTTDSLEAIRNTAPLGTAMRGTDSAFLAASAPTNFGSLSISTAGAIGTVTTLTNKTGFAVSSTGLNAVVLAEPSAVPTWGTVKLKDGIAWNVAFNRNKVISNTTEITLRNNADAADIATAPVTATTSSVTRGTYS